MLSVPIMVYARARWIAVTRPTLREKGDGNNGPRAQVSTGPGLRDSKMLEQIEAKQIMEI